MIIRRIRIVLPARLRATAATEARVIAEALATEMSARGLSDAKQSLTLPGAGQGGAGLAHRIGAALPGRGGRHGG